MTVLFCHFLREEEKREIKGYCVLFGHFGMLKLLLKMHGQHIPHLLDCQNQEVHKRHT